MPSLEASKQHLASLRRKDLLPRLRNDLSTCSFSQLFCLELCGSCFYSESVISSESGGVWLFPMMPHWSLPT